MRVRCGIIFAVASLIVSPTWGQSPLKCDAVLAPTIESSKSDYRLLQAYMSVNSSEEYDRLKLMSQAAREAQASYKVFKAQFNSSNTSSEFREKVSKRLSSENYSTNESDARATYRKGPTDAQVEAWSKCASAGGLIVTTRDITNGEFTTQINWFPPVGVGRVPVTINLSGGTINGQATVSTFFDARGSFGYIVRAAPGASTTRLVINTAGLTDALLVTYGSSVKLVERVITCDEGDPCPNASRVLQCLPSMEKPTEFESPGEWMSGPDGPPTPSRTSIIRFGNWQNTDCGLSGNGWHARVGTCGKGKNPDSAWYRCSQVKAEALVPE